jgi:NDP-sugar pyrophosphorylase family protein
MNALILAAGFGIRLERDVNDYLDSQGLCSEFLRSQVAGKPKALVPIKIGAEERKPLISYQLLQLQSAGVQPEKIYIYTNKLYQQQFLDWARSVGIPEDNVLENGVICNDERKEQTRDMLDAIKLIGTERPLFVLASDTLIHQQEGQIYGLDKVTRIYREQCKSVITGYYKSSGACNHGILETDEENSLISFAEKPNGVESGIVNSSVYLFSPEVLGIILGNLDQLLDYNNPLQFSQLWPFFKVARVSSRTDVGRLEDVLRLNGFTEVQK